MNTVTKTAAVTRVLAEATKPLAPADVMAALNAVGLRRVNVIDGARPESTDAVRAILGYLA